MMDFNSPHDFKRLEQQIFSYKANIKSSVRKRHIINRLRNQLRSKAIVRVQRIDEECEHLMLSLKRRLMLLQNISIQKDQTFVSPKSNKSIKFDETSDEESVCTFISKKRQNEILKTGYGNNVGARVNQHSDISELVQSCIPMAFRKNFEKELSYSSASTSHSHTNRIVTTSGISFHSEELAVQEEVNATPTLHIKIPSLYRGNVHYIILDSLKHARKVLDQRSKSKISKAQKRHINLANVSDLEELHNEDTENEFSQLLENIMADPCTDETSQTASALKSMNKNVNDAYHIAINDNLIPDSQSSEELTWSQNSNTFHTDDTTKINNNADKKSRKYKKRRSEEQLNAPPKKRGRRPKKKNNNVPLGPQLPTKSWSTPAASSTRSQPLVSSTTHNYDVVERLIKPQELQASQEQPITFYIDGDWANGGLCHLVPTGTSADERKPNQDDINSTFQDYVNYIDKSCDSDNNVMASNLQSNISLPISIPLTVSNLGLHSKLDNPESQRQNYYQPTIQDSSAPIINIQIPILPKLNINTSALSFANMYKEVLDLSLKHRPSERGFTDFHLNEIATKKSETYCFNEEEDCLPLDLSAKDGSAKATSTENCCVGMNTQDEDFICRLIDQNDFSYSIDEVKSNASAASNKSFRAALDMPLLDFDTTELAKLEHSMDKISEEEQNVIDGVDSNERANNQDSNYVSMAATDHLNSSDQSTADIFDKLLDICPQTRLLSDFDSGFIANDDLNESIMKDFTNQKYHLKKGKIDFCNSTPDEDNKSVKNIAGESPLISTSLIGHLNSSDTIMDMSIDISNTQNATNDIINKIGSKSQKYSTDEKDEAKNIEATVICKNYEDTVNGKHNDDVANNTSSSLLSGKIEVLEDYTGDKSKPINNVVFSVKKINLSEEDTLYTTDSDTSSRLSFELGEHKNMSTDETHLPLSPYCIDIVPQCVNDDSKTSVVCVLNKQTFVDKTLTLGNDRSKTRNNFGNDSAEDINLSVSFKEYNAYDNSLNTGTNEITQRPNVEKNLNEEQVCISKGLEDTTDITNVKGKTDKKSSNLVYANLTPLELESKLDCLDFDEDLDDALSLATSCFNSPNDERFEDCVVNMPTRITDNTSQDKYESSSYPQQMKDFKHFKIAEANHSAETNSKRFSNKLENKLPDNSISTLNTNKKIVTATKRGLEQINRISDDVLLRRGLEDESKITTNIILKVFGISCFPYLVDKCNAITNCQLSHELIDPEKVYAHLNTLDKFEVNFMYHAMYRHKKLFQVYFKVFCSYYSAKNDRSKLLNMLNDCERYPEFPGFIIIIYEALIACGLNCINACRLLLKHIRERNIGTYLIDTLVTIIMKSDWTMFTDFIEKYTQDMYKYNFRIHTLEQMAADVLKSKDSHLKQVFGRCLQTLHCNDTALLLNSPSLIQGVALLSTNAQ